MTTRKAMKLREAVRIVDDVRVLTNPEEAGRYLQARDILREMVAVHEAFEEWQDRPETPPAGYPAGHPRVKWIKASNRLRALVQGKEEVEPYEHIKQNYKDVEES